MKSTKPILLWFRRDLRVSDHAALSAACSQGAPVIPVFVKDGLVDGLGAAPKWRLGQSLAAFDQTLKAKGSRLVLRSGDALDELRRLCHDVDAQGLYWTRLYDPQSVARDTHIKAELRRDGINARSFGGHLMFEPWTVQTKTGGLYKVYTPFWRNVKDRDVDAPLPAPDLPQAPDIWPKSEALEAWKLDQEVQRGASVLAQHGVIGEQAAQTRLAEFIEHDVADYVPMRDIPSVQGTSGLSENLALGEISPHQCWHAGLRAWHTGKSGAEVFLKELVWREFAYHLMHHTPHILETNWKPDWDKFAWKTDENAPEVLAWKQGRTGVEFVDAAMREMYVTGKMHNRGRMIVASYLTKHLMTHWRVGKAWFEECLTDWDEASNAMGWQWAAGSGPDASPFFRVFNPATQLDKFDADRRYTRKWIAEGQAAPPTSALSYFDAVPRSWGLSAAAPYPKQFISLAQGRERALQAYAGRGF